MPIVSRALRKARRLLPSPTMRRAGAHRSRYRAASSPPIATTTRHSCPVSPMRSGPRQFGDLSYSYDVAGNRKSASGSLASIELPAATTSTATYDAANRLTSWNSTTLTYDDNGSLTSDGTRTYTWDARNRPLGMSGWLPPTLQQIGTAAVAASVPTAAAIGGGLGYALGIASRNSRSCGCP